jgi:hypothetical protein
MHVYICTCKLVRVLVDIKYTVIIIIRRRCAQVVVPSCVCMWVCACLSVCVFTSSDSSANFYIPKLPNISPSAVYALQGNPQEDHELQYYQPQYHGLVNLEAPTPLGPHVPEQNAAHGPGAQAAASSWPAGHTSGSIPQSYGASARHGVPSNVMHHPNQAVVLHPIQAMTPSNPHQGAPVQANGNTPSAPFQQAASPYISNSAPKQPKVLQPKIATSVMQQEHRDREYDCADVSSHGSFKMLGDDLPPPPPLKKPAHPVAEMVEALTPRTHVPEVKDPKLKAIDISNEIHQSAMKAIKSVEQEEMVSHPRNARDPPACIYFTPRGVLHVIQSLMRKLGQHTMLYT